MIVGDVVFTAPTRKGYRTSPSGTTWVLALDGLGVLSIGWTDKENSQKAEQEHLVRSLQYPGSGSVMERCTFNGGCGAAVVLTVGWICKFSDPCFFLIDTHL